MGWQFIHPETDERPETFVALRLTALHEGSGELPKSGRWWDDGKTLPNNQRQHKSFNNTFTFASGMVLVDGLTCLVASRFGSLKVLVKLLLHMYPYVEKNSSDNPLWDPNKYWSNLFRVACHHGVIGNFGFTWTYTHHILTCNETHWNFSFKQSKENVSRQRYAKRLDQLQAFPENTNKKTGDNLDFFRMDFLIQIFWDDPQCPQWPTPLLKSGLWRIRPQERKAGRNATKKWEWKSRHYEWICLHLQFGSSQQSIPLCKNSLVVTVMGVV